MIQLCFLKKSAYCLNRKLTFLISRENQYKMGKGTSAVFPLLRLNQMLAISLNHPLQCTVAPRLPFTYVSKMSIRTGFFRDDPDFIDPQTVMYSESVDEWRFAHDGSFKSEVLERNNVGMGLLILNNNSLTLRTINGLYRRLRELEINSLKRLTILTSFQRSTFCKGRRLKDLLLFAEMSHLNGKVPSIALEILRNQYELSWLIRDYFKPLISLMNGWTEESGLPLVTLANHSAAYFHSIFQCTHCANGWFPDAGLSYSLSRLPHSLGLYIALTGYPLKGSNLITSGLCKYWMSPEAIPFLELTSEKFLEISERDVLQLLQEHFLEPPEETAASDDTERASWAKNSLSRIHQCSPLSIAVTMALFAAIARYRQQLLQTPPEAIKKYLLSPFLKSISTSPLSKIENSSISYQKIIEKHCFNFCLHNEMLIAEKLLLKKDTSSALFRSLIQTTSPIKWEFSTIREAVSHVKSWNFPCFEESFFVRERSEFPLSAYPNIRALNPHYNPLTGLDHDPTFMKQE
ncbi:enoyl-CoA hydratase/isomerase family protein, partial [Cardiosporidium cionae]